MQGPKVVLFDIESTSLNADFGYCLAFGWKELGRGTKIVRITADSQKVHRAPDDRMVVRAALGVLSSADLIVSWYGKRFDVPFLQARLLYYGMGIIPPVPHVDCWEVCRSKLKLSSNRLANASDFLGLAQKTVLSGQTWVKAAFGDKPSLKYIVDHCKRDVDVLEQAYLRLRPLVSQHPNLNLITGTGGCPVCGGSVQSRGWTIASLRRSRRYQCIKCGHWSRGKPEAVAGVSERGIR